MNGKIIQLNVGGTTYSTTKESLLSEPNSLFTSKYNQSTNSFDFIKDTEGRFFIDRDGKLFQFILDFLRNKKVVLPTDFVDRPRLKNEAEFYKLTAMVKFFDNAISISRKVSIEELISDQVNLSVNSKKRSTGCIVIGYRGTFANGRDGLVDVKFRKVSRILVCGRVNLCREAFGDSLNESRDPDHGVSDRYTSRYYLKHSFLEQAFDNLLENDFKLVCASATGANSGNSYCDKDVANKHHLMNTDNEENKWLHYNEYVFIRE